MTRVYWGWSRKWRVPHAFTGRTHNSRSLCGRVRSQAAERLDGHPPTRPCLGCVDIGIKRGHFPDPDQDETTMPTKTPLNNVETDGARPTRSPCICCGRGLLEDGTCIEGDECASEGEQGGCP